MCIRITERYAVCKCPYYTHGVDQCSAYGRKGHPVQDKTVFVGHSCTRHTAGPAATPSLGVLPDYSSSSSGYSYR